MTARSSRRRRRSASRARSTTPAFPRNAVAYCLREAGVRLAEIDNVVFYDKPWIKFERMLETYLGFAPKGLKSFLTAMPVWLKEKLNLKSLGAQARTRVARRRQAQRRSAVALHRASPGACGLGVFPEPVRARRGALPGRRGRMGDDLALARRGQSAQRRNGRSIFRIRSACSIRPSPTTPASRSIRASTS